jgi:hypothetical protein
VHQRRALPIMASIVCSFFTERPTPYAAFYGSHSPGIY